MESRPAFGGERRTRESVVLVGHFVSIDGGLVLNEASIANGYRGERRISK